MTDPNEPVALITGASRGLGFAMAEALAPDYHIVAVARTVGGLEDLDDRIKAKGGAATLAPMDITQDAAMQHLCRSIHERWGGVRLWIHTAFHDTQLSPVDHIDAKDWDKAIALNVRATGIMITYVAPLLGRDGTAVFFDDPSTSGAKFFGAYGATKAAQIAQARSWQAETAKNGPRVHIATPNPMPTALRARFYPGEDRSPLADPHNEAARILAEL
ncbi:SDR family NAD(P)-dependent oxidoreductase [Profundibacter sp.]|uniref:SDR family NAD(P)-dependent oxidoreductase n=1 Tax=Profundibacter sp. TaxID=3101071 RepID=UPI003D14CF97